MKNLKIGEILLNKGIITPTQLNEAIKLSADVVSCGGSFHRTASYRRHCLSARLGCAHAVRLQSDTIERTGDRQAAITHRSTIRRSWD